jgi:hypothetical protein
MLASRRADDAENRAAAVAVTGRDEGDGNEDTERNAATSDEDGDDGE